VRALSLALVLGAACAAPAVASAEWVAGDLHVHTTYSHDSYGGPGDDNTAPDEFFTLGHTVSGQFAVAASRGLDYVAITDHNDVRSQSDPGFGSGGVLAVPGYEASLKGHGQALGARRVYDAGDRSTAAVADLAAALRADGGVLQVNHPADPPWEYGFDVPVDTVEVWNLPWYYQRPFPSSSDNDRALNVWYGWLDRGSRVTATGGSDSHWISTTAAQGVGQPTTWVDVRERTAAGVLDGLRAGRTYVSHEPPTLGGPGVFLEADADGDGTFEAMVGDTVSGSAQLRVRVTGAPGATLRLVGDGGRQLGEVATVDSPAFEHRFRAPAGTTWVHAQVYGEDRRDEREELCVALVGADLSEQTTYCRNRVAMLALSSALYLREPATAPGAPSVAPGRARLRMPRGCRRRPFSARVTGTGVTGVRFSLDGRRARAVGPRFALRVDTRRLTSGPHRVRARVSFGSGGPVTLSRRFRVCRAPAFTG
jgi:hypothetical protein